MERKRRIIYKDYESKHNEGWLIGRSRNKYFFVETLRGDIIEVHYTRILLNDYERDYFIRDNKVQGLEKVDDIVVENETPTKKEENHKPSVWEIIGSIKKETTPAAQSINK